MKSVRFFLFLGMLASHGQAVANDGHLAIGDETNLVTPTNEDFKKINQAVEYYEAKIRLVEAQRAIKDAVTGSSGGSDVGSDSSRGLPKSLRGRGEGDALIDSRGNRVEFKPDPTAFINTVNGIGGNLSAEIVWGDRIVQVRRGDTSLGGGWEVASVNKENVVLVRDGKRIRLGSIPVKISSMME